MNGLKFPGFLLAPTHNTEIMYTTGLQFPYHSISSTCVQLGQRLLGGQRLVVGHIWARIWRSLV